VAPREARGLKLATRETFVSLASKKGGIPAKGKGFRGGGKGKCESLYAGEETQDRMLYFGGPWGTASGDN